ncbi:type I-B CRISPR-associated protein Cas5 [Candidatus Bathyarchaeota archaeon]|nr:type I-B CRISPR-associated protein Cas5 [Candidatus Bathyarchaeota archaeon]
MRVLVFDVWGDYGHFRKFYTTTSPLTFSIPPRTALCGLIGAILGLGKDEYIERLSKKEAKISVRPVNEVRKIRFAENLIDTKKAGRHMNEISARTQIRFEFLKDPRFRVYFSHRSSSIMDQLRELVSDHRCVYTPCLGLSEHIAEFGYLGEFEGEEEILNENVYIHSVIPESDIIKLEFEEDREYISELMPVEMDSNRIVKEYSNILFERKANPIRAKVKGFTKLKGFENVVFL